MAKPGTDGNDPITDGGPKGDGLTQDSDLTKIERAADEEEGSDQAGLEKPGSVDKDAGRDAEDASVAKVQAFMVKHGIKEIGDLVDRTSDLESKKTKLSQDVQRLSVASRF